jgi:copper/silver efflux system protein
VKARIEEVRGALPAGVRLVTTYDRAGLIRESIGTLRTTLSRRCSSCPGRDALPVPLPVGAHSDHHAADRGAEPRSCPCTTSGVSSNIMSLGGIALAIGQLVDASIVMVENAYRRLSEPDGTRPGAPARAPAGGRHRGRAKQVGRPLFFSLAIIIISFVPVFMLEAQEGRMFRPLAFTKTFAMASATLLSITLVPVLMTIFVRGRQLRPEGAEPDLARSSRRSTARARLALRWKWARCWR